MLLVLFCCCCCLLGLWIEEGVEGASREGVETEDLLGRRMGVVDGLDVLFSSCSSLGLRDAEGDVKISAFRLRMSGC